MKTHRCSHPSCKRFAYARGLCQSHYMLTRYHVKKGNITWEKGLAGMNRRTNGMLPKEKSETCKRPTCGKPSHTRGLCRCCYETAARLVRSKKTDWKSLEKSGKCSSPLKTGASSHVSDWLLSK